MNWLYLVATALALVYMLVLLVVYLAGWGA